MTDTTSPEHPISPERAGSDRPTAQAPDPRMLTIINRKGLHARASAKLVQVAASFQSEITIAKDGVRVVGTSIMGLLMLAAAPGCVIEASAIGSDAVQALDAIEALVKDRFGESE